MFARIGKLITGQSLPLTSGSSDANWQIVWPKRTGMAFNKMLQHLADHGHICHIFETLIALQACRINLAKTQAVYQDCNLYANWCGITNHPHAKNTHHRSSPGNPIRIRWNYCSGKYDCTQILQIKQYFALYKYHKLINCISVRCCPYKLC